MGYVISKGCKAVVQKNKNQATTIIVSYKKGVCVCSCAMAHCVAQRTTSGLLCATQVF